jgi:transketolase
MGLIATDHIRRTILEQSHRAHVGHIGSALSIVDILAAVYSSLDIADPDAPDRDRFILSNGHTALALYALLHELGILSQTELDTFCGDGSYLGVHPEHTVRGIEYSSGSLGQGISFAAGCALAARLQNSHRRVFVLLSDAECNEGSVWEAAAFAAHHNLANLVAIIDLNEQQALGYTQDVLNLAPMSEKWRAFHWEAEDVDGSSAADIARCIASLNTRSGKPHVLVAHTIFGKGVSFMEKQIKWHYMPMTLEEYQRAMQENPLQQ